MGAAILEGMQIQTRETARLRGKLTGSKRSREEVDVGPLKTASDDESESKAVAIKKKARFDPFDVLHGKKKQNKDTETTIVKPDLSVPPRNDLAIESSDEIERILNSADKTDVSPPKSRKKRSKIKHITDAMDISVQKAPPPSKVNTSLEIPPTSPRCPSKRVC